MGKYKSSIFIIAILVSIICIGSIYIDKEPTEKSLSQITAGMSEWEVKRLLGLPDEICTDNKQAQDERDFDKETELYEYWDGRWGSQEGFLNGAQEDDLVRQLDNTKNLTYYLYEYTDFSGTDSLHNIYFIDHKVVMISYYISFYQV